MQHIFLPPDKLCMFTQNIVLLECFVVRFLFYIAYYAENIQNLCMLCRSVEKTNWKIFSESLDKSPILLYNLA